MSWCERWPRNCRRRSWNRGEREGNGRTGSRHYSAKAKSDITAKEKRGSEKTNRKEKQK